MSPNDLVMAARAAVQELVCVGIGHGHTHSAVVVEQLQAALKDAEKHVGVLFMPVPRCSSCRFWGHQEVAIRGMKPCQFRDAGMYVYGEDEGGSLATAPDFGCVKWEKQP